MLTVFVLAYGVGLGFSLSRSGRQLRRLRRRIYQ
jgi:hypothetical protein